MKFIIKNNGLVWFMGIREDDDDFEDYENYEPEYICLMLELTIERYREIMIEIGAKQSKHDYFWFRTEEDARKVIEDLEPYLIMEKLIK